MNLNNIQLPASIYQSIFSNKLVDLRDRSAHINSKSKLKIDYLGGNEKNIVFVTNNDQHKFLDDNQLKFLSNLISACNITMADIAVVNMNNNEEVNYAKLFGCLSCRKVLCFGVSSGEIDLPFTIPFYQVQTFEEVQYIFCPALDQLQDNPEEKKLLWESLQKIFKIAGKK